MDNDSSAVQKNNDKNEDRSLEIKQKILETIDKDVVSSIEFEGPYVVIFIRDPNYIETHQELIKDIAAKIRRKVIVKADKAHLKDVEEARELIQQIVPKEAEIKSIRFAPDLHEVYIEAYKSGLVIGKNGSTLREIFVKTGWLPKIWRVPSIQSESIDELRNLIINDSSKRKKFLTLLGKNINKVILKTDWLKVTALGGFREVGRSCLLVETKESKVIIDCGISPEPGVMGSSSDASRAFPYIADAKIPINEIDAIILTHGHMDHMGFIPYLYKYGYEGPVYSTLPTIDLAALLLKDYVKLVARSGGTPLYEEKDIRKMIDHMVPLEYNEVATITDEIKLTYHNAGHIIGSASAHLHIGEGLYNIVHTGDLKFGYSRLLDPADTAYTRVDGLFIESTYGGNHDINSSNREQSEIELMEAIKSTVENNGKILIPVFSVGRAQEIQLTLEYYMTNNDRYKLDVPIYLDGMVLEANAIHTAYPDYLKKSLRNRILSNMSPFESELFQVIKRESDRVDDTRSAIIIASGGMLNGGASLQYFRDLLSDERNTLIFVGYNSQNSLGRKLQNGVREIALEDDEGKLREYNVKMNIKTIEGFSGHSDRRQLMNFIKSIKTRPRSIFTMHGEEVKCEEFARAIYRSFNINARAPMNLDSMRLK
ncbi:MAG: ribonuclease J [Candidatus Micrarchaeota archaeon]|nr:MAG: ribonuclease J [Candidatus Micrarchaeota archaeon]